MNPPHPLFSEDAEELWIDISLVADSVEDKELASIVIEDRERVIARAVEVLGRFLKNDDREVWKSAVSDHWILPCDDKSRGYYTYLQFALDHDRASSDSWWVIVACPQPFFAEELQRLEIRMGVRMRF